VVMTQPVTFDPVRAVRGSRIAPAEKPGDPLAPSTAYAAVPQVPLSKLTNLAGQLAAEGPPLDNVRIAQLSQAIAAGDFRVDTAAIAEAILQRAAASRE
jgi:flagellar biosynthesis anti-sigma factor FlgM